MHVPVQGTLLVAARRHELKVFDHEVQVPTLIRISFERHLNAGYGLHCVQLHGRVVVRIGLGWGRGVFVGMGYLTRAAAVVEITDQLLVAVVILLASCAHSRRTAGGKSQQHGLAAHHSMDGRKAERQQGPHGGRVSTCLERRGADRLRHLCARQSLPERPLGFTSFALATIPRTKLCGGPKNAVPSLAQPC